MKALYRGGFSKPLYIGGFAHRWGFTGSLGELQIDRKLYKALSRGGFASKDGTLCSCSYELYTHIHTHMYTFPSFFLQIQGCFTKPLYIGEFSKLLGALQSLHKEGALHIWREFAKPLYR